MSILHYITPVYVTNSPGFDWWQFLLGGFAGSFIAAVIVLGMQYILNKKVQSRETKSRRLILLQNLKLNLERISNKIVPYNINKVILMDSIPRIIVSPLLSGETITYDKEPILLNKLIDLNVAISKYNDTVSSYTLSQVSTIMDDVPHKQAYDNLKERFDYMIQAKIALLKDDALRNI